MEWHKWRVKSQWQSMRFNLLENPKLGVSCFPERPLQASNLPVDWYSIELCDCRYKQPKGISSTEWLGSALWERSSDIQRELEKGQSGWTGHLVRMPPGHPPWRYPRQGSLEEISRFNPKFTAQITCFSLPWICLGFLARNEDVLQGKALEYHVHPANPAPDEQREKDGWMDVTSY